MFLVNMDRHTGFTLVEVLVSLTIFALVIVGLSSVFVAGGKLIMHNRERMTSAQLGKFFLDPLQAYVRQDTWDSAGPVPAANELRVGSRPGVFSPQTINNRRFTEVINVTAVGNLRRVIANISWPEPSS